MVEQRQQHTPITVPETHVVGAALPHRPAMSAILMPHLLQHPKFFCFYSSPPHKDNLAQKLLHQGMLYCMLTLNTCKQQPQAFLTLVWLLSSRLDHLFKSKVPCSCFFQIQLTRTVLCPFEGTSFHRVTENLEFFCMGHAIQRQISMPGDKIKLLEQVKGKKVLGSGGKMQIYSSKLSKIRDLALNPFLSSIASKISSENTFLFNFYHTSLKNTLFLTLPSNFSVPAMLHKLQLDFFFQLEKQTQILCL